MKKKIEQSFPKEQVGTIKNHKSGCQGSIQLLLILYDYDPSYTKSKTIIIGTTMHTYLSNH